MKWLKLTPSLIWAGIIIGGAILWSMFKSYFTSAKVIDVKVRANTQRDKLRQAIKDGDTKALREEALAWAREKK